MAALPPNKKINRDLPHVLAEEVVFLEDWFKANRLDSRKDKVKFWILKLTAICATSFSGLFSYFDWKLADILMSSFAAICVAIDGLQPRNNLYAAHKQAQYDIRQLQEFIVTEWQSGCIMEEDKPKLIVEIVNAVYEEKKRISSYLSASESKLG